MNPDKNVDLTIIEIKPNKDRIYNFIEVDENEIRKNKEILNITIYMYHLDEENNITSSYGLINEGIDYSKIKNGSPIFSCETLKIIGIYYDDLENYKERFNDIIDDFNNKKYTNEINIIYKTNKEGEEDIFGKKFVENNKNNIKLIINENENKIDLIRRYKLKKGENNIKIIIKNKITNLEYMFEYCKSLINIEELKYLDTKDINNFSYMFFGCSSLSDIKGLQNWDVSKGNNFSNMFRG